jgi:hypothetical protein
MGNDIRAGGRVLLLRTNADNGPMFGALSDGLSAQHKSLVEWYAFSAKKHSYLITVYMYI